MPFMEPDARVDFKSTYATWNALNYFALPAPDPYLIDRDTPFHEFDPFGGGYMVTFPHLIEFRLTPDGELTPKILVTDAELLRLTLFCECTTGVPESALLARCIGWLAAAGARLLDQYCLAGFGRLDDSFLKVYYGGSLNEFQDKAPFCLTSV